MILLSDKVDRALAHRPLFREHTFEPSNGPLGALCALELLDSCPSDFRGGYCWVGVRLCTRVEP